MYIVVVGGGKVGYYLAKELLEARWARAAGEQYEADVGARSGTDRAPAGHPRPGSLSSR